MNRSAPDLKQNAKYYVNQELSEELKQYEVARCLVRKNDVRIDPTGSNIIQFLKGKSIFITGGTGFLGRLLIEKLLRCCEDIECIYVLLRSKKEVDIDTRLKKICDEVIFEPLKRIQPNFINKLVPINGDFALPGLGISSEDRKKISEKISIIYHVAATVKFDEKIKLATAINIKGPMEIIKLARECKNLESILHVSTAYTNCNRKLDIDEKFYDVPFSAETLIDYIDLKSDEELEKLTPSIIGSWPNTYTFTKAVAENYLKNNAKDLPISIFRPAIVTSTVKEPLRNWSDSINGLNGIILGLGFGVIRALHADFSKRMEYVPADYVINGMIAASYQNTLLKSKDDLPKIYNYISSPENPLKNSFILEETTKLGVHSPTIHALWYGSLTPIKNTILYHIVAFFLHIVPAVLLDTVCYFTNQPRVMMKLTEKIHKFNKVLLYFIFNDWEWKNDNTQNLWKSLSKEDKVAFPFSMGELNWKEYFKYYVPHARIYLAKDPIETLPVALKKWHRLYYYHQILKATSLVIVIGLLYMVFRVILT